MQLVVDFWSTSLAVAATATAAQLSVPPVEAEKLVGLGDGDFYVLVLAERDPLTGAELRREIVHVTAVSGGLLTASRHEEGTTAQVWDEGTLIEARLTAASVRRLQAVPGGTVSSVVAGDGLAVDDSDPAAPVVALSAATLTQLLSMASRVSALEAVVAALAPPHSVVVTPEWAELEPGSYVMGYQLEVPGLVPPLGLMTPTSLDTPYDGTVGITIVTVHQSAGVAEFHLTLSGDHESGHAGIQQILVAGIGMLTFEDSGFSSVPYDPETDTTGFVWSIAQHNWDGSFSRLVTFIFAT
jgi:hypothetical protein